MAEKYEYTTRVVEKDGGDLLAVLNEAGEEGWRLASIFAPPDSKKVAVILERNKK